MLNIYKALAVGFSFARTNFQITVMKKIITELCSSALNSNVSSVTMCSFWSAHQDLKVISWSQVLKDLSYMSMVTKVYASLIKKNQLYAALEIYINMLLQ